MKIAIFPGFGFEGVPEWLMKPDYSNCSWRFELADKIMELKDTHEVGVKATDDEIRDLESGKVKYFKQGNLFLYKGIYGCRTISIEDVDISKPWRIADYDGSESLEYFKGVKVVDEKYNMCTW